MYPQHVFWARNKENSFTIHTLIWRPGHIVMPENLSLLHANNKGADQPAHQRSLISTFVIESLPAKNDIQTYFI